MTVLTSMAVTLVHVVDIVLVRDRDVATTLAVAVLVAGVLGVRGSAHDVFSSIVVCGSVAWRTASRAMCAT
jgi:hypothetical protein